MIDIDISDHLLVYAIRKKIKPPTTHAHLSEPKISLSKLPQFNTEFREIDWSDQLSLGNPDVILAQFHTKLNIIQNKYTSIGKVRPRQVKLPWLNSQILKLLKQKASSLKQFRLHRTPESKNDHIKIRNQCTTECVSVQNTFPNKLTHIMLRLCHNVQSSPFPKLTNCVQCCFLGTCRAQVIYI